jgi:FlaA1/EpsC-like NDP-sugar epimerase
MNEGHKNQHHKDTPYAETHFGQRNVLIIGAGEAGQMTARGLFRSPRSQLIPVGFLDDDPNKHAQQIEGLNVFGALHDLPKVLEQLHIDELIIAMPSAPGEVIRRMIDLARQVGLRYRTLPSLQEILSGSVNALGIREVKLEDLLRRDPVKLDTEKIVHSIAGRTVLITGAGGSIGSEIARQVAQVKPKQLILLGRGENSIYSVEQELRRNYPNVQVIPVIADVKHYAKLKWLFKTYKPQIVFHAAAHKHVPLMEASPDEAILNNVRGTQNVATLSLEYGVTTLVNISTDKAVNPTSVMGASKRVAEYVVADAARRTLPEQAFISVRFGNVLGSRGSVIPLFKEQIRVGGPVTITHPDMVRYFMTIPEAVQLVLQAGSFGNNGEVYVLDMGKPVRILDLAHDIIRLSGLEPERDIRIEVTGMRPGEKLFEELLTAEDGTVAGEHDKLFVARVEVPDAATLHRHLNNLYDAAEGFEVEQMKRVLAQLIPYYTTAFNQSLEPASLVTVS